MPITQERVIFPNGVKAYLARPEGRPGVPGVVVLAEIWGVDAHIRSVVDRFAEAGYAAIAPDLLGMEVTIDPAVLRAGFGAFRAIPPEDRTNPERILAALHTVPAEHRGQLMDIIGAASASLTPAGLASIQAAVDYLKAQGAPKVGVTGFCHGGRCTLAFAYAGGRADAFAPFYGDIPPDPDPSKVQAPLEGHFGAEDPGIAIPPIEAAAAALRAQGKEATIHVYPGAPHAFFNDTKGGYHPEAAKQAWERVLAFFKRTLA